MEHKVRVTDKAYAQIDEIVGYISKDAPETARRWCTRLLREIDSLKSFPLRYGLAPESQKSRSDVRQMLFGVYRVLYVVENKLVIVLGIRHGRRRPFRPGELTDPT